MQKLRPLTMDYLVHKLLNAESLKSLQKTLLANELSWQDGKKTAGSHASKVKNNLQLDRKSKISTLASEKIIQCITSDPLIKSFSLPKRIHGVMFTRSSKGHGYGMHVDNPYMSSGRSDLSFTLFLNERNDYEGGELCIQEMQGHKNFKLDAGEIIVYPSTTLHSVQKVISGERLVCVGWIESYVSSNEERSLLFNLDAGAKALLSKYGRSDELDLIFLAYSNLLRRLGR